MTARYTQSVTEEQIGMGLTYSLESLETTASGKQALIVTPSDQEKEELAFNIDTFSTISVAPEKAEQKRIAERQKTEDQLKLAEAAGDEVAVEKLNNQLRYGGGEPIAHQITKYVNMFFELISDEHCDIIYKYLYDCQTVIHELNISNNSYVAKELTRLTTEMMGKTDLAEKLINFTKWLKVPLPDPSQIGNRAHHSASKTFAVRDPQQPDYLEMTAISFWAKVMFPVWGHYCNKMKSVGIGSIDKEFYCLQFCEEGISKSKFNRIFDKFTLYVYDEVNRELNKTAHHSYGNESNYDKNSFIVGKLMYDESRFGFLQLAKLIVKRLVTFNTQVSSLKGEDNIPNVMIYLQAIIKKNVANTLRQFNKHSGLLTRDEPRGGSDDNFTFMENCSRISQFPPDRPIYTRRGVELSIPREVERRGLSMEHFNQIIEFYKGENLPRRNIFTDSILSIFLFPIIGSSKNLNHLRAKQYVMAIALCQMILLKSGESYGISLALMLSSKTSLLPRENKVGPTTTYIQATAEKTPEYKALMDRYPHSCETIILNESIIGSKPRGEKDKVKGTINIAKHVGLIKDWIIDYEHYVNLYPLLWKYFPALSGDTRQKQNDILRYSETIMDDYYRLILDVCHPVADKERNKEFWDELGFRS